MVVKKAKPLPTECIVRGYLAGSGWKDYQKTGTVCGIPMPKGLLESSKLPEPIFTPSTKAEEGHDLNIPFDQMKIILKDAALAEKVRDLSLALYRRGRDLAEEKGILIADTKFEFGLLNGKLILIDEVMTPDSSRFWPKDGYQPGRAQASFDKQFVRDYLETLKDWKKTPPGPVLPDAVVEKTREKYVEAYEKLTGRVFGA
jgi:phosphoribosylaminoimidazole-succinocarboxamide synthase